MGKDKKMKIMEAKKEPSVEDGDLIMKAEKPKKNRFVACLRRAWRAITKPLKRRASSAVPMEDSKANDIIEQHRASLAEPVILGKNLIRVCAFVHREDEPDTETALTNEQVREEEDEAGPVKALDDQTENDKESVPEDERLKIESRLIEVDRKIPVEEDAVDHSEKSTDMISEDHPAAVGYFFTDIQEPEDELAKKRAAFFRKQQKKEEVARLRKEQRQAEVEIKREEVRRKAEEDRVQKEERRTRRELIKQEHLHHKPEQIEKEQEMRRPQTKSKPTKTWAKSVQNDESHSEAKHSSTCPKLYKEHSSKSNKLIIHNALLRSCLAGKVNERQRNSTLAELHKCDSSHYIILLRKDGGQFRALYSYNPDTEDITKLTGTGPKSITKSMMDKLYKYSSDRKEFTVLPGAKTMSLSVDALTIDNNLWQAKRPAMPQKSPLK